MFASDGPRTVCRFARNIGIYESPSRFPETSSPGSAGKALFRGLNAPIEEVVLPRALDARVSEATDRAGSIGIETLRISVAMLFRGGCLAYARCWEARFMCLSWRGLTGLEGRSSQPCGRGTDVALRMAFQG